MGPGAKRAAAVPPQALASKAKKHKDQDDGDEQLNANTETATRILRRALHRIALKALPPDALWTREFWQALNVRADPATTAILERLATALVAWAEAGEAAETKHEATSSEGARRMREAVATVVAVAALHPQRSSTARLVHTRVRQIVGKLDRELALQGAAANDFCAAHRRIGRISNAYDALLSQMELSDGFTPEVELSCQSEPAHVAVTLRKRLEASSTSLKHAKDELEAANRAVVDAEAAVEACEHERAAAAALEFEVAQEQANAIARVEVRYSTADPAASAKQRALQASRETAKRCQLVVVSALLSTVEQQWTRQCEASRKLADAFVKKHFPVLVDALYTSFVEGSALQRKLSAEVSRRQEKQSRLAAFSKLGAPSEELKARQRKNEQKLERCKSEQEMLQQSLVTEVQAQQATKSRSQRVLPPGGFRFVAQQYTQLFQRCTASDANEGLMQDVASKCVSVDEETKEDEGAEIEQIAASSANGTCSLM